MNYVYDLTCYRAMLLFKCTSRNAFCTLYAQFKVIIKLDRHASTVAETR